MREILYSKFNGAETLEIAGIEIEYHPLTKQINSTGTLEQGHVYYGDDKKYFGKITKTSSFVTFEHFPAETEYTCTDIESAISQAITTNT